MSLPVGTIIGIIGADPRVPPDGWLYCNGGSFDGVTYRDLAAILHDNRLPNLVGLSLIGASPAGESYPPSALGAGGGNQQNADGTYGTDTHKLTLDQMPSHQHFGFGEALSDWCYGTSGDPNNLGSGKLDYNNYFYGTSFSGGQHHDDGTITTNAFGLIQPSYALYFFIRATVDGEEVVDV